MTTPTPAEPTRGQVEGVPPEVGGAANARAWGLAPTPAVERAADALYDDVTSVARAGGASVRLLAHQLAQTALTAALTDPDDPDSLARTLYVLYWGVRNVPAEEAGRQWSAAFEPVRETWRAVADGLRMMLTGSGS